MMKVKVHNEENMKKFASGNYPDDMAKKMYDECIDNVQLWQLSKVDI